MYRLLCWIGCIFISTTALSASPSSSQPTFTKMAAEVRTQMAKYARTMKTKEWTYETAAKDLPVQVGSLTKLLMQLKNERYRHNQTDAEIKEKLADELADMLSLVLFIANELDIDLTVAWQKMLESDDRKIQERASKMKI